MIIRLAEGIFVAIVAGGIGTVVSKKLASVINKHFEREAELDKREDEHRTAP